MHWVQNKIKAFGACLQPGLLLYSCKLCRFVNPNLTMIERFSKRVFMPYFTWIFSINYFFLTLVFYDFGTLFWVIPLHNLTLGTVTMFKLLLFFHHDMVSVTDKILRKQQTFNTHWMHFLKVASYGDKFM